MKNHPEIPAVTFERLIFNFGWEFKSAIAITMIYLGKKGFDALLGNKIDEKTKPIKEALTKQGEQITEMRIYLSRVVHSKDNEIAARDGVIDLSNQAMNEALSNIEKINLVTKNDI